MLMHFAVQQPTVGAAQASVERLLQLPPEALHGLTAEERAAIVNFNVPLDGVSALAPFATLGGRVLAGDGAPIPGAIVTVTNASAIFSGNMVATTGATGEYRLSTLTPGTFEARARHPLTNSVTPPVSGVVGPADTTITQDFVVHELGQPQRHRPLRRRRAGRDRRRAVDAREPGALTGPSRSLRTAAIDSRGSMPVSTRCKRPVPCGLAAGGRDGGGGAIDDRRSASQRDRHGSGHHHPE